VPRLAACALLYKIKHVIIVMQENRSFDSYFRLHHPTAKGGRSYPGRGGGLWLWTVFLPSGLRAWLVPSGWTVRVQPSWWSRTW
jgi:hypothetical protein